MLLAWGEAVGAHGGWIALGAVVSIASLALALAQPATREREVRALTAAMRSLGLDRGLILTDSNAVPITENGFTIAIRSLVEWLLQPEQQGT